MSQGVQNRLAAIRKSRGVGAADLARRVGVSRQAIYAMEAGTYVPNTEVTLRLARELETSVEEIFTLAGDSPNASAPLATRVLSRDQIAKSRPARLGRVGEQWVSVPVSASPYYLPQADGVISSLGRTGRKADVLPFSEDNAFQKRLIMAGCDPATSLLAATLEKTTGIEVVTASASSKLALSWLKEGVTHIAGSHLEDPESGEFNLPYLRQQFPNADFAVITFAQWEEGLAVAPGNPKRITKIEHLANRNVRFVNRETGSGARELADRLMRQAGVVASRVRGYRVEAQGHLAAAYAVFAGDADCCLVTRSAAQAFGLNFVPLKGERYDLVMHRQTLQLSALQSLLDVLQRATLRRQLETLAGYDTRQTGATLA
ncbi:MAG: substrate-binding domain-containing protein [Bryobacteraceae bacterium]